MLTGPNEFNLIRRFFRDQFSSSESVVIGIGDDAAVTTLTPGQALVTTVDTLVAGIHFPQQTAAADIGYKSLAVSLSDLAAMAAKPAWFTLALTLPESDTEWLEEFSRGLRQLAEASDISLIGGDTTRGPLSITIQAMGSLSQGEAVQRCGGQVGDIIYTTGTLGDAAAGLAALTGQLNLELQQYEYCLSRLNRPTPRIQEGLALGPLVTAMVDCSDGMAADLSHITTASQVGAVISLADLPFSFPVKKIVAETGDYHLPLAGGDDYELIFTAPVSQQAAIAELSEIFPIRAIGHIVAQPGIVFRRADGSDYLLNQSGFQHF